MKEFQIIVESYDTLQRKTYRMMASFMEVFSGKLLKQSREKETTQKSSII
jgi:hypothetical protein